MRLKHFGKHPYFNRRQNLADALYRRAKKILKKNMRLNTLAFNRTSQSQKPKTILPLTLFLQLL